jgi:hypothetical protein
MEDNLAVVTAAGVKWKAAPHKPNFAQDTAWFVDCARIWFNMSRSDCPPLNRQSHRGRRGRYFGASLTAT